MRGDSVCFICRRKDRTCNLLLSAAGNAVKTDIIKIFDFAIQDFLDDADSVCEICRGESVTRFEDESAAPLNVIWDPFLKRIIDCNPENATYSLSNEHLHSTELDSVNNLLIPIQEVSFADRRSRSQRERNDSEHYDEEVAKAFSRRKGHRWTRIKGGGSSNRDRKSRSRSRSSSRPKSNTSGVSSVQSRKLRKEEIENRKRVMVLEEFIRRKTEKRSLVPDAYVDSLKQFAKEIGFVKSVPFISRSSSADFGATDHSSPIGRSASAPSLGAESKKSFTDTRCNCQLLEELLTKYQLLKHECTVKCCTDVFDDLKDLTVHMVRDHGQDARFWCDCCKFNFVTQHDLDRHNLEEHNSILENCPCCSQLFRGKIELHQHLQEHLVHQVPCIYCDKFFLSKDECESHIKRFHRGRKRKIKTLHPSGILARVYKNGEPEHPHLDSPVNFSVKVLFQCKRFGRDDDIETAFAEVEQSQAGGETLHE